MKTQQITLLEAINFVMSDKVVEVISPKADSIQLDGDRITITIPPNTVKTNRSTRLLTSKDMFWLKDDLFHAGDDRSIKGYYH